MAPVTMAEIEGMHFILVDGRKVKLLPDCTKCGLNQYRLTGDGLFLVCPCGAKYYNRGRV